MSQSNNAEGHLPRTEVSDLIWGAQAIAKFIGRTPRATFHMLERGDVPASKVGRRWVASRAELLKAILDQGRAA